jgi:outer membrane protein TolC
MNHTLGYHRLLLSLLFLWGTISTAWAQSVNLDQCYDAARTQHPLARQQSLLSEQLQYQLDNLQKKWYPKVVLNGQATLQSEVTELPLELPGVEIPSISKDQYKVFADINQTLYDGGAVRVQKNLQQLNEQVANQQVEVSLYQLKEQIQKAYFGVLLLDAQEDQLALLRKDLANARKKVRAAIDNGLAFPSQETVLEAEGLKLDQREIELKHARATFIGLLNQMTGLELTPDSKLDRPAMPGADDLNLNRPETLLFKRQRTLVSAQAQMQEAQRKPKAGVFVQTGFGRPALNFLSNDFRPYAIGGLRLTWDLSGYYTRKNDAQLIEVKRQQIDIQEEAFQYQNNLQLSQQDQEVARLSALLETDRAIIALREKIRQTASAQLENGVMTATDYLKELNAEDQARQSLLVHEVQLLQAQFNRLNTLGNQ